jgi:outer membrane receptor for ferrienterochelin and colicins
VIGRLGGNVDLSQINLSGIDHIEIIEGPLSVEYGSNALAGTFNLISKKNSNTAQTSQ